MYTCVCSSASLLKIMRLTVFMYLGVQALATCLKLYNANNTIPRSYPLLLMVSYVSHAADRSRWLDVDQEIIRGKIE